MYIAISITAIVLVYIILDKLAPNVEKLEDTSADVIVEISKIEANVTKRADAVIEEVTRGRRGVYE